VSRQFAGMGKLRRSLEEMGMLEKKET